MRLSNQAVGAIMMALQNAILKEQDITETLREFEIGVSEENELGVNNPPTVSGMEKDNEEG